MKSTMVVPIGRNGLYGNITADRSKYPEHVLAFIFDYGERQILNDAVSGKEDKEGVRLTNKDIWAKAQAKYDQLVAGDLRKRRESGEPADPVTAEAFKLAKVKIEKALKKHGVWPTKGEDKLQRAIDARMKQLKKEAMSVEEYITTWLEVDVALVDAAKKIVAEKAALGDVGEVAGL